MDGTMTDYDKFVAKKGLEGIVFDTSSVSNVIPQEKSLYYRGYPVQDLAENCSFEETAYLLINGDLPNATQLADFEASERAARELSPSLLEVIERFPRKGHPMDSIRTVVSYLGMEPEFAGDETPESARKKGTMLLAKIPTAIAAFQRIRHGKPPISPKKDLSIAANFFRMCFGEVPDATIVKAFDGSLTMYAEHSFNASTFTARVVVSTLADLCGAITAAIASLKGPLHGGANEEVMYMLQEIGTADKAQAWLDERLAKKEKIMGFGHRVYRLGDSRVPTMSKFRDQMAELKGGQRWVEISNIIETGMREKKNIYPNLDFPAGPAYFLMGFEIDMFTPIFVMARTAGWVAHVVEQLSENRLVRPLAEYIGPKPRATKPISERS
jgi:2-methylcitrate synthase